MNKNQLIEIVINSPTINNTLNKVQPDYLRDDFRQEFYLILLQKSEEQLLEVYNRGENALERFAGQIIRNQLVSNMSPFYKQYRKNYIDESDFKAQNRQFDDPGNDELTQRGKTERKEDLQYKKILLMLNHIHPSKSKLFIEYWVNNKTFNQIARQYRIKYITVYKSIKNTEKIIRESFKAL